MKPSSPLIAVLLAAAAAFAQQPSGAAKAPAIKGHALGETVSEFRAKQPDARPIEWDYDGNTKIKPGGQRAAYEFNDKKPGVDSASTKAFFDGGRLVRLEVLIINMAMGQALQGDLVEKFGPYSDRDDVVQQNGFGAKFHTWFLYWKLGAFYAEAMLKDHSAVVKLMIPSEHARQVIAEEASRSKPLE